MGPIALPVHHVHIFCDLIRPDLKVPNALSLALFFVKSGPIYNCSDGLLHLGGLTASWINWFKTNRSSSPLHQLLTGLGFCFQPAPQPPPTRAQHFAYMTPRHTCRYLRLPFSPGHAHSLPTFPICTITSVIRMSGLGTADGIRLWPLLSSSSRFHESSPLISTLTLRLPSVQ